MRIFSLAALAVLAAAGTAPANAAAWTCTGPEYVCGGSPARASKPSGGSWFGTPSYKPSKQAAKAKPAKAQPVAWSWFSPSESTYSKPKKAAYVAPAKPKATKSAWTPSWSGGGSQYQSGQASYYWQPQKVASGGNFNPNAMTAAHKTLPFGTKVRVTNQRNGQSVVVTINDRGPYVGGRVIDLSSAAAGAISMKGAGVAPVSLAVLGK